MSLPGHVSVHQTVMPSVGQLPASQTLDLAIGLPLRNPVGLTNLLRQIYDPASLDYRRYLTPAQFTERFGPTEAEYQALIDYVQTNGFTVTARHSNRLLLDVRGPTAAIQAAFHTTLRLYRHPTENRDFYAPDTEPTVPSGLPVLDISGLNNATRPHPKYRLPAAAPQPAAPRAPKAGSAPGGDYLAADLRAAYAPGVTLTGAGQSVGLFQFDGYSPSDIRAYETLTGLPNVPLVNVLLNGFNGQPTGNGGEIEVTLDIEMAIAMAPGLSSVIVYMGGPAGIPNDILNRMATDNLAKQLSCSWGWAGGPRATTEQIFLQMAAQGQSFFNASGDLAAFLPGQVDDPFYTGSPTSSPNITQVGGTTLTTPGPAGPWLAETVWNSGNRYGPLFDGIGSAGGVSSVYPIPSWQQPIDMSANGGSTTFRNIPDVALTADDIYIIANGAPMPGTTGTSIAAPLWAGFMALVNEQAAALSRPPVGFLNPTLYTLAAGPDYPGTFHDITTGDNTWSASPNQYFAAPGYDLCTGWGTPNGQPLIDVLTRVAGGPRVEYASATYTVGEASPGFATITVLNIGGAAGSVDFATSDGTAVAGINYLSRSGTLSFAQGQTTTNFTVIVLDDSISAGNLTVNLTLSNPQGGAVLGSITRAVLTIVDDDTPSVTGVGGEFNFSTYVSGFPFYDCTENETFIFPCNNQIKTIFLPDRTADGLLCTVVRTNGATGRVLVDYATAVGGTGIPFFDYIPISGTLVFDDQQMSTNFLVEVINSFFLDTNLFPVPLTVQLVLSNPRPAPEEEQQRPGLIRPTLGLGATSTIRIHQVNSFPGFSFERMSYRVDEYPGGNVLATDGTRVINIDVINPTGMGDTLRVRLYSRGSGYINAGLPLRAGSDYAEYPESTWPNPTYTDPALSTIVNPNDYVELIESSDMNDNPLIADITFSDGQCRRAVQLVITNDSSVEFNEDVLVFLEPIIGVTQMPIHPFADICNVTILYHEQTAGAVDREWNPDNVEDTEPHFNPTPGANSTVNAVAVQEDGKSVIGGDFTAYNAVRRNRVARINQDGSLDTTFQPGTGTDNSVNALAIYSTFVGTNTMLTNINVGRIILAGAFTSYNGAPRNRIARLLPDGTLDPTFTPGLGADGPIHAVAILGEENKVLIAGDFTAVNGVPRNRIARLNDNGSLDLTFDAGEGPNGTIRTLALEGELPPTELSAGQSGFGPLEDRRVLDTMRNFGIVTVIRNFFNIPDTIRVYYQGARIFDSGLVNNQFDFVTGMWIPVTNVFTFGPGSSTLLAVVVNEGGGNPFTEWEYTLRVESPPEGGRRILLGGDFTSFSGVALRHVARLFPNGSVDGTFNPGEGANDPVYAIGSTPERKILIGGAFTEVDSRRQNGIARLNQDGSLDTTFASGFGCDDAVYALAIQADGKPVIGGIFTTFNRTRRLGLARLKLDGSLDTSFLDTAYNQFAGLIKTYSFEPPHYLNTIALQPDGNVMIGGSFTNLGGNPSRLAPLRNRYTVFTRADKRTRFNVARLLGGATPGPGNATFDTLENVVDENAGLVRVKLNRIDGRLGTLMAQSGTSDRTATSSQDYTATNMNNTWPQWASRQADAPIQAGRVDPIYIPIPILDDLLEEGDELVDLSWLKPEGSITLGGELVPLGGALGPSPVKLTITDNDFPHGQFNFASPTYLTNEGAPFASITVLRTNGSVGAVSVDYFSRNSSLSPIATAGADYTAVSNTLRFASGQTTGTLFVPLLEDDAVELDEHLELVLTNATGGAQLPGGAPTAIATATLTLIDNDFAPGRLSFSAAAYRTNEGAGFALLTVERAGGTVGAIFVDAAATPGTAADGTDFIARTNRLNWANGDGAAKTFLVPVLTDGLVDGAKTVNLTLQNPSLPDLLGNQTTATLFLDDTDQYGQLAFSQTLYEADENGTHAIITVVRQGGIAGTVSVEYRVRDGTAINGTNYLATNGVLQLGPGQTSQSFSLDLLDNDVPDGNKFFTLHLTNAINASLGLSSTATNLIVDDESFNIPAGSLDSTFNERAGANNAVFALGLQSDGRILMAGDFTVANGVSRNRLGRLLPNGDLDPAYNAGLGPNGPVRALALDQDGKAILGGFFDQIHGTNRNHIARLDTDGTLDVFFDPGAGTDNPVFAIALTRERRILIGGSFTTVRGVSRPNLAMLNTNGTLFTGFDPRLGPNGPVFAVALQEDGRIVIGGDFTTVNNVPRSRIARLNADGSVDASFDPGLGFDQTVRAILVQPDGRILVGGSFNFFGENLRYYLARLEPDGTLDTSFLAGDFSGLSASGGDGSVFALALQRDGKIVVAGDFTTFNGVTRGRITRLNRDGSTDPTINFGSGADSFIAALLIQPDRKIVVGGGFTTFQDKPRKYLARLYGGSIAGSGQMEFSRPEYAVAENAGAAVVTVRRLGGTTGDVSVNYASSDGTATSGVDYTNVAGTLFFPQGEVVQRFAVPIISDALIEGDETVHLALTTNGASGVQLGPQPTATLTIVSDDSLFRFQTATYSANENVVSHFATIAVEREGTTNSTASVDFFTTAGTATPGLDYTNVSDTLTFVPGERFKTFFVPIVDDVQVEGDESVLLFLTNAVPAGTPITRSTAVLTIVDNDFAAGQFVFTQPVYSVNEYETNLTVTVLRTNGRTGVVSVNYATSDGTARAGQDYLPVGGTLTFNDNETAKVINVPIIPDYLAETNETVIIALANPTGGATLGGISTATITILNNNLVNGNLNFAAADYSVGESNLQVTLTVTRSFGALGNVAVSYRTLDGTASKGLDYLGATNVLSWPDGDFSPKSLTVEVANDSIVEGAEFFAVELFSPTGGATLGSRPSARVTILDDDTGPGFLSFVSGGYFVDENGTNAMVTVSRTFGSSGTVSIDFTTTPGSALANVDYFPTNGTLTFDDGVVSQRFFIAVSNNIVVRGNRTVSLGLSNPAGGASTNGQIIAATLTILEDDQEAGSIDASFGGQGASGPVEVVVIQTNNNKLLVGGQFANFSGLPRPYAARLNPNGSVDTSFDVAPALNAPVQALAVRADDRAYLGGFFTNAFTNSIGQRVSFLARVLPDGMMDTNFFANLSGLDNYVAALALQNDGRLVVGGQFTSINGISRQHIARLEPTGALDIGFSPAAEANGLVRSIAVQMDGKIVLGGDFTLVNGVARNRVARLNANGTLDSSFDPGSGADASVTAVAVQSDGKVLVAGLFTSFNDAPQNRLVRLEVDGTMDPTFVPGAAADEFISALALQGDGKIVAGGAFTHFNGALRNRLARLTANGEVDATINLGAGANNFVSTIAIQPDRKIVIGGGFTEFNGVPRNYIARLNGGDNVGFGSIAFSAADFSVVEGNTNFTVTVRRFIGTSNTVSVAFETMDDTALAGVHYLPTNGVLTFGPGETIATFSVTILDDTDVNPDRTIRLALSDPRGGAVLGLPSTATISILNNDQVISFALSDFSVSENAGAALITVDRIGGTVGTVSINFSTQDGSAQAGVDYVATNGTLTFVDGQGQQSFLVPILNDLEVEGNETLQLLLTNPSGTATQGLANATLTIVDDDFSAGMISFAQATFTVSESSSNAVITVVRTAGSVGSASVNFSSRDGTATATLDYSPVSGLLVFADGEFTKTFSLKILDDALVEGNESVLLTLSNPVGGALGLSSATLTIQADEAVLSFVAASLSVIESATNAIITVTRAGGATGPVTVEFRTSDGSALAGLDYSDTVGSLTFQPGDFQQTFLVPIFNDFSGEGNETVNLLLANVMGEGRLAAPSNAVLTIIDDDTSFSFDQPNYTFAEDAGVALINVLRTGVSAGTVSVQLATSDGSARAGLDYVFTSTNVVFGDGETSKVVAVPILDDLLGEGNESFEVDLLNPSSGSSIGAPGAATVTIVDNEDTFSFTAEAYAVAENGTNAVIFVQRTGRPSSTNVATIRVATSNGSALAGADYSGVSNTLTFVLGETLKAVTIPILDDGFVEGNETVALRLFEPTGGPSLVAPTNAVLTIVDNDVAVAFSSASFTVEESGTNAVISVGLLGATTNVVSVGFASSNGTATANADYAPVSGVLVFAPGQTNQSFAVSILDDLAIEGNETVLLGLFNVTNGILGHPSNATLVVLDNDSSTIVGAGSALVSESLSPGNGLIDPGETVTLQLALRNVGNVDTAELVATLLATNGVISPSGPQAYGALMAGGATVSRPFTFTATGTSGSRITVTLSLRDGLNSLGTVAFEFVLGQGTITFANPGGITINDLAAATPYPSSLVVSNIAGEVVKLTVTLINLSHDYPDDLDILLLGPRGQSVMLMSDAGGANLVRNITLTFDDTSSGALPNDDPALSTRAYRTANFGVATDPFPTNGLAFAPQPPYGTSLFAFNGVDPNGTWRLFIVDDQRGDAGNIAGGWSLAFTTTDPIQSSADVSVSVLDAPDPVVGGASLIYALDVVNHGPGLATNVMVIDQLPAGLTFIGAGSSSGTYTQSAGQVTFRLGNLPVGAAVTMFITNATPLVTTETVVFNTATVLGGPVDLNIDNNITTVKTTIALPPVMLISRKDDKVVIAWPLSAGNLILESADTLPALVWTTVTDPRTVTGDLISVTLDAGGPHRFYRLRSQ